MSDPVAVIGGGLGGLSAGVTLAQRGARVVLFEKEPHVGGYAIAFQRGEFTFDLSLHVVPGGGAGGQFRRLIETLGVGDAVSFIRLSEGFRVVMGDYVFQMPNGEDELFEKLAAEFPHERKNLHALRRNLISHARVYVPLLDSSVSKWRTVPRFIPRLPVFLHLSMIDTKRYLSRFIRDSRVIAILFQPSALMGIHMDELPAINFIVMFHILLAEGMYTIKGGGQALTDALEKRFVSLGGTVVTRAEVEKIIVRDGRAVAVRTAGGKEQPVSGVIAGISPIVLTQRLLDSEHVPASYLKALDRLHPSMSAAAVNLGLDCHPRDVGVRHHMTLLIPPEDVGTGQRPHPGTYRMAGFAVTARGNSEPDAPASFANTLSLVGLADLAEWQKLSPEEYRRRKEEMADDLLQRLEHYYPGLPSRVRVRNAATPLTMHRYTGNPNGAISGFDCLCGTHRWIMRVRRLPIRNMQLAGAWTDRLGGFMQSCRAGIEAGNNLARELRMDVNGSK